MKQELPPTPPPPPKQNEFSKAVLSHFCTENYPFRVVRDNINWSLSKDRSNQMLQFETDKNCLDFHGQNRATLNHDQ